MKKKFFSINAFALIATIQTVIFAPLVVNADTVAAAKQIPLSQSSIATQTIDEGMDIAPIASRTGISDYPMLKVGGDSPFAGVYDLWGGTGKNIIKVICGDYDMDGTNAFMFYVKMPGTAGGTSTLKFQLFLNQGAESLQLNDSAPLIYALAKNTSSWESIGWGYSFGTKSWQGLTLPGGFEGWIRIPWPAFYGTVMANYMQGNPTGYFLSYLAFSFDYVGAGYGDGYLGALMIATNDVLSGDRIIVDDRGVAQSLFTLPKSADATLSALSINGGEYALTPAFAAGTYSYEAEVPFFESSVTVGATVNDVGKASFDIVNDDGSGVIELDIGPNPVTITVTAENNWAAQDYTVTVTRAAPNQELLEVIRDILLKKPPINAQDYTCGKTMSILELLAVKQYLLS